MVKEVPEETQEEERGPIVEDNEVNPFDREEEPKETEKSKEPEEKPEEPVKEDEQLKALEEANQKLQEQLTTTQQQHEQFVRQTQDAILKQPEKTEEKQAWQPKSWDEVETRAEEKARKVFEETQVKQKEQEDQAKAKQKEIDDYLDKQVAQLEKDGFLPPIKDKNDPTDKGKLLRQELFGLAANTETVNLIETAKTLRVAHKAGQHYDPRTKDFVEKKQPAGADAPIGSSTSRSATNASPAMSYKDLHNKTYSQLIREYEK